MRVRLQVGVLALVLIPLCARGYEEITVTNGGSITGFVRAQGKVPKLPPLEVFKFKEVCKGVPDETLVVGPRQGVRYAIITIGGITRGKANETEAVHELDNLKCRFVPHAQAASIGQWLLIKNSDPILHTAHASFSNGQPQFNVALPPGKTVRKPLISTGLVRIICEVRHTWMSAYIMVTDHPYHAVTDVYGEYEIRDVPPGTYSLKVWHEKLGTQEKRIEVNSGAVSKADFVLKLPEGAKK